MQSLETRGIAHKEKLNICMPVSDRGGGSDNWGNLFHPLSLPLFLYWQNSLRTPQLFLPIIHPRSWKAASSNSWVTSSLSPSRVFLLASLISSFFPTKPIHTHPPPTWHRTAPGGGITGNIGWGYLHYQFLNLRLQYLLCLRPQMAQHFHWISIHEGKIGKLNKCMYVYKFLYHEV